MVTPIKLADFDQIFGSLIGNEHLVMCSIQLLRRLILPLREQSFRVRVWAAPSKRSRMSFLQTQDACFGLDLPRA